MWKEQKVITGDTVSTKRVKLVCDCQEPFNLLK